eukprot:4509042-Ditylum_brightwellii.AAC.1
MKHSEEHNHLANKKHGGQEGHASINIVAITRFTSGIHHYQQSNASMTDCDAKSCYNRIAPRTTCPPLHQSLMSTASSRTIIFCSHSTGICHANVPRIVKGKSGSIMTRPTNTMTLRRNVDMIADDVTLSHTNTFDTDPNLL